MTEQLGTLKKVINFYPKYIFLQLYCHTHICSLDLPIAILLLLRPCFSRMDILVWVRKKGGRDFEDVFPSFKDVQLRAVLIMTSEVEEANQFGSPDAARLR